MSIRLDRPQIVGGNAVAAIVRQEVEAHAVHGTIWGHGAVMPLGYLCLVEGEEAAFDGGGTPMSHEAVEALLPEAWDQFRTAVALAQPRQPE